VKIKVNKYGVYKSDDTELIEFEVKQAECDIRLLQVSKNKWVTAISYNFNTGNYSGYHAPLGDYKDDDFKTRKEALTSSVTLLVRMIAGCIGRNQHTSTAQLKAGLKLLTQLEQYSGIDFQQGTVQQGNLFGECL